MAFTLHSGGEERSNQQFFLPNVGKAVITLEERRNRLSQSAYRYQSPLTRTQKLNLELQKKALEISGLGGECVLNPTLINAVPAHWQVLANYLHREGLLHDAAIRFDPLFNDEPKYYSVRLWGAAPVGLTSGGTELSSGRYSRGVSHDPEEAFSKVFGEFLERYPLTIYANEELLHASVRDLQKRGCHFLNPFDVAPTAPWQKKRKNKFSFSEESVFRWVQGRSLTRDTAAYLPAQMVFWNYRFGEQEPVIHYPITNGAGGMFTTEEAILSGLYELIQRDAFFIHWFNFISPARIDLRTSDHPDVRRMVRDCERYALEPYVLDITSDLGVPAFLAVLIDLTGKGPAVALGGGCGMSEEEGIVRALSESLGVRSWLRKQEKSYALPEPYEPFTTYVSQSDRLLLWNDRAVLPRIEFLLRGPVRAARKGASASFQDPTAELAHLVRQVGNKGPEYEVFYYEARHKVLSTLGYHSVAVAVPALLPLYFNEEAAPLGSSRIQDACRALGHEPAAEPNGFPHPFP